MNPRYHRYVVFSLCALAGILLTAPFSRAATINSSIVDVEITYTFGGAFFTSGGAPAAGGGTDYEFDGPVDHFYDLVQTFVFTEGDGAASQTGTAEIGSATHTFPNAAPDFSLFNPFTEEVTLTLGTTGQSSAPDSNGSAGIESVLSYFVSIFTLESLTFEIDYSYTYSMTLVEDAPDGGQGNGFVNVDAALIQNDITVIPGVVDEGFGGPGTIVDNMGSGTIQFVTAAEEDFAELLISTNVNSTTLVPPIPEPSRALLLLIGTFGAALRRRRSS